MSRQQLLLKQELTVSQILRTYRNQILMQYSDGKNGRCAIVVIMSYFGWDGKDDVRASRKLLSAFIALTNAGVSKDLVVQLNDLKRIVHILSNTIQLLHDLIKTHWQNT